MILLKCGMEQGKVTALEVGDIQRDIAFHGDPLNTAARLPSLCKEYERALSHAIDPSRSKGEDQQDPANGEEGEGQR